MNRILRSSVIGLLALAVLAGCSANSGGPNPRGGQASRAVPVEVKKAQQENFSVPITLSGRLKALQEVDVVAKASGRVKQVMVKVGDRVRAGQPILTLDEEELQIQKQRAEASLQAAKARYAKALEGTDEETLAQTANTLRELENKYQQALVDLERAETLFREGAISTAEVEQARLALSTARTNLENQRQKANLEKKGPSQTDLQAAEAERKQAEADYALTQLNLQNMTVLAPIDGIVGSLETSVGENVSNNSVVAKIANLEKLKVVARASEGQVGQFEPGKTVKVTVSSISLTLDGKIITVSPIADETKAYPIEIEVSNPDLKAKAGMVASIEMQGTPRQAVVVPREAVVSRGADYYVFIVQDGKAKQTKVTPGETDGEKVEILSGLQGGEDVVVQGQNTLVTEAAVTVIDPNQPQSDKQKAPGNRQRPAGSVGGPPAGPPNGPGPGAPRG